MISERVKNEECTFLVLQVTIQHDNSWVLNLPSHASVGHVLVEHNTGQDLRFLNSTSWDLLYL